MHFEEQYPNKPPGVKFISDMFHPNVYATGELCLDILQNRWSPTYDVAAILTSIQRLVWGTISSASSSREANGVVLVCSTTQTLQVLPMSRPAISIKIIEKNTRSVCVKPSRRAGRIEPLVFMMIDDWPHDEPRAMIPYFAFREVSIGRE